MLTELIDPLYEDDAQKNYRMLGKEDLELLDILESNFDQIYSLHKERLIDIIKALRKENDELKNVQRSPLGEEIIKDEEIIQDEDEYL